MPRRRSIVPAVLASVVLATAALLAPAGARADNPGVGQVIAVGDHVLPGETLTIRGWQLDPGAELVLRLSTTSNVIELGRAVVAADGTIETSAPVPGDAQLGYATISATDPAGTEWTSTVLIGERPEGPAAIGASGGPIDERTVGLVLLAIGIVVFAVAGAAFLRGRPRGTATPD